MVTVGLSAGIFGIIIFLIVGYILVKGVIGILKAFGHFVLKLFGRE